MQNIAKQPIQADNPPRLTISEMVNECQYCHALLFPGEDLSLCYTNGNVQLPAELLLLENLLNLYQTDDENSRFLRQNIRSYKNHFSFASTQCNLQPYPGRGGFVFCICSQIGHRVGPLHPGQNENQHYGQLTFTMLMWLSSNALEIMKVLMLTSIHSYLEPSNLSCVNTTYLQQLTGTCMRSN